MSIRKGDTVYYWPGNLSEIAERDGTGGLTCSAIVTCISQDQICLHYFLPEGSNGSITLMGEAALPASSPERGRWWPRPDQ